MKVAGLIALAWLSAGALTWSVLVAKGIIRECYRNASRSATVGVSIGVILFWPGVVVLRLWGDLLRECP